MPDVVHIHVFPALAVYLGDTPLIRLAENTQDPVNRDDERCLALLSVLCRRPVEPEMLQPIKVAAHYWAAGDRALANLRLAFAGLPKLAKADDVPRLKAAAYCLDHGMAPRELMNALDLDSSVLNKFDPTQPRVPAGNGRESGRWTDGAFGEASLSNPDSPSLVPFITLAATTGNFKYACKVLGLDPKAASDALHRAKKFARLGGSDNCVFDLETGEIFFNDEHIGNLGE